MLTRNLLTHTQFRRVSGATAAGTTAVNSSSVDTAGYMGAGFIVSLGAVTATGVPSVKVQQSDDDGSADDWTDLAGSKVAGTDQDGSKLLIVEIHKPIKRYVRAVVERTTANVAVEAVLAYNVGPQVGPPPLHASCAKTKAVNSPQEGTA